MLFRLTPLVAALASIPLACFAQVQWDDSLLKPFVIDHRAATASPADLAFLHDAPAGKDGFIRMQSGHFVKPDGKRIRFWGVHLTDWSPGSIELPAKEDTPMWARHFGALWRQHGPPAFHRQWAPTGITDGSKDDTRSFDRAAARPAGFPGLRAQEERHLHGSQPQRRPLLQGRRRRPDFEQINRNWVKSLTLYDKRIIELEKEYARNLLTHVNPYTKTEYRNEPAIAIVEILNENGIVKAFVRRRIFTQTNWTALYNTWLKANLTPEQLQKLREEAGVQGDAPFRDSRAMPAPPRRRTVTKPRCRFFMDLGEQVLPGHEELSAGVWA